ncbi:MAG: DUF2267 domain-containing protein [Planctomycetes bacterium]|nr:DUF2267 domain-containing protein [Planctomycetota bacterium]
MAMLGSLGFLESTFDKTHDWLKEINAQLHWEDYHKSWQALRAVMHTLRDRLPMEEAVDLGAQIPLLVRGLYYEGWRPFDTPMKIRHLEDFLQIVEQEYGPDPNVDPMRITEAVMSVLNSKITPGEIDDIRSNMPEDIRRIWPTKKAA